ncbi:MAG: lasso peptide biosynthesis B2 protein [Mariprofundales bacterium]
MIKILLRKCKSFLRSPLREKLWFAFLFISFALIRALLLLTPFRLLAPYLGRHHKNYELASVVTEQQRLLAWRIGQITERIAGYTPWESKCLVQAIGARLLLGWYGIPYVMYLGVTKPKGQSIKAMKAHAWLCVGPWIITGRDGHKAFTIVSTFIAPSILQSNNTSK